MPDYNGVTWRVNYGEIAERNQFRVGYIGQQSFDAYFEVTQITDLISVLTAVQGMSIGQLSKGTTVQARKASAGVVTTVIIEPRLDTFPTQIMDLDFSTLSDLIYALQLFQTALSGLPIPDDWDGSYVPPIVWLDKKGQLQPPNNAISQALSEVAPGLHTSDVAGATVLAVLHEHTYELNATATATVTLTGLPGAQCAVVWSGSAGTLEGTAMTAGSTAVAVKLTAGWRVYVVGASSGPAPDMTDPTAGTLSVVTSYTTADLTVTGAMDETALHSSPYAYSTDNGSTWSAWQTDPAFQFAGLASSNSFSFRHRVRDAAGNIKTGATVTKSTTTPTSWSTWAQDDFTGADGSIAGRLTPTGSKPWEVNSADWAYGESAGIASGKLKLAATTYRDVKASVPYPPLSSGEAHVRVTFDYDVSGGGIVGAMIETNGSGQPIGISIRAGVAVNGGADSNDSWSAPTVSAVAPTSGTAITEYYRKSDGSLTCTCTVGGIVVFAMTGTAVPWKAQPGSSQKIGVGATSSVADPTNYSTVDNLVVEYAS